MNINNRFPDFSGLDSEGLNALNTSEPEFDKPIRHTQVDFAVNCDQITRAKQKGWVLLKLILFPWFAFDCIRASFGALTMMICNPAQSHLRKRLSFPALRVDAVKRAKKAAAVALRKKGYIVKQIVLEKDGQRFSGLMIGHKTTIDNGHWVLQASGAYVPVEYMIHKMTAIDIPEINPEDMSPAESFYEAKFNLLAINFANVGESEGSFLPTPEELGEAHEIGLTFLEQAVKAKKIALSGYSLGGAAIGQALLNHPLKETVKYRVFREMTFGKLHDVVEDALESTPILARIASFLVRVGNMDLNLLSASKILEAKQVQEVVIQSSSHFGDGVISKRASLEEALKAEKIIANKKFIQITGSHITNHAVTEVTQELLRWNKE